MCSHLRALLLEGADALALAAQLRLQRMERQQRLLPLPQCLPHRLTPNIALSRPAQAPQTSKIQLITTSR